MRGTRRFSQAVSEGDGISLLAEVSGAEPARSAEEQGAEAIVVRGGDLAEVRAATELPVLSCATDSLEQAQLAGADACLLVAESYEDDEGGLARLHAEALELGLDCVIEVRNEDELQLVLDRVDPEIFLLSARGTETDEELEHVLGLLPDVPAGKLAIAEVDVRTRDEVIELERAGVDGVIVRSADVALLVGEGTLEA